MGATIILHEKEGEASESKADIADTTRTSHRRRHPPQQRMHGSLMLTVVTSGKTPFLSGKAENTKSPLI